MVKSPFACYKGIVEFSVRLLLFLASNVYGGGWSASRIGRFNPGYISLRTHWIRRLDGSQGRLWSSGEKRRLLPRPGIALCLLGCRGYSLDRGCEPMARGKFSLARCIHCFPGILYVFPTKLLHILENVCVCVCIHTHTHTHTHT